MTITKKYIAPSIAIAILSAASFWIVGEGATNEPYVVLTKYDTFTQVGVATALILCWILYSIWIASQIYAKRLHRIWAATFIWMLIVLFYLKTSPLGFLSDLVQFHGAK